MIQRLKRLYKLSKKDPDAIEYLEKHLDELPDADTKAEFLGSGTEEEYREQENQDKFGVSKLFDEL